MKKLFFLLSTLFLFSNCNTFVDHGEHIEGSRLDSVLQENPPTKKKVENKFNFKDLQGKWLIISTHKGDDTIVADYFKDTITYNYHQATFRTFDSIGGYYDVLGDYGQIGKFKIDSAKYIITYYHDRKGGADTLNRSRIIFLDHDHLLTESDYDKGRYFHFFKKTMMKDVHWGG